MWHGIEVVTLIFHFSPDNLVGIASKIFLLLQRLSLATLIHFVPEAHAVEIKLVLH